MTKQQILEMLEQYCNSPTRKRQVMSLSYARQTSEYVKRFLESLPEHIPRGSDFKLALKNFLRSGERKSSSNRVIATAMCAFFRDCYLIEKAEEAEEIISRFPAPQPDWSSIALQPEEQRELLETLRLRGPHFSRVRDYFATALMLVSCIRVGQLTGITSWAVSDTAFCFSVPRQKSAKIEMLGIEIPLDIYLPDDVYFNDITELYLQKLYQQFPRSQYLFVNRKGERLTENYLRNYYARYAPAELEIHPHKLRHTGITAIARYNIADASYVAGHASITTTQRYVKPQPSTAGILRKAWERSDE